MGEPWIILEKEVKLDQGLFLMDYSLRKERGYIHSNPFNDTITGLYLEGRVLETKYEKIKIKLDIDNYQNADTAFEFPYLPITGNIMYSMPEAGSHVVLYFPDNDENHAFVVNSFMDKNHTYQKEIKGIKTDDGKSMIFGGDFIQLSSQKAGIMISDQKGISVVSGNQMKVFSNENIVLQCSGLCSIQSEKGIFMEQEGGKDSLTIDGCEMIIKSSKTITSGLPPQVKMELLPKEAIAISQKNLSDDMACMVNGGIPIGSGNSIENMVLGMLPQFASPSEPAASGADELCIKD